MLENLVPERSAFRSLRKALQACRRHFWWAALFSAAVNVLYLTPTLYMMQVYDRVVPTGGIATLVVLTFIALLALASLSALDWLRGRLLLRASLRLDRSLAVSLLQRVSSQAHASSGTRLMREFDQLRSTVGGQAAVALFDAPWTPLYLACCFLLHPAIGALTLFGGVALILLAVANERATRTRLHKAMQASNSAYSAQESLVGQHEVIRALGMRDVSVQKQMLERQETSNRQADAHLVGGYFTSAIKFLRLALQSIALGLAAWLVIKGQLSAGAIIASSVLLSRAVAPVEVLVAAWPSLVQAKANWKNLIELFEKTADQEERPTQLPRPNPKLELEGVFHRYPGSDEFQLRNISLHLRPGEILGVMGLSGSGKSTLARLMAHGLKPSQGKIRLDGADYEVWAPDVLGRYIGYLPQSPSLFPGTIKENIARFVTVSEQDISAIDQDVIAAAQAAGAHDMILRLAKGYDTQLGPFGAGLSAGQAQRVALARAVFRNPVLLVLDEPNSNLDQEGEIALMKAVKGAASRGAAVVIVAHRTGILAQADRLALMVDGTLKIEGPRPEVMEKIAASTRTSVAAH